MNVLYKQQARATDPYPWSAPLEEVRLQKR